MTFFFCDCIWYIGGRGRQNVTTEFVNKFVIFRPWDGDKFRDPTTLDHKMTVCHNFFHFKHHCIVEIPLTRVVYPRPRETQFKSVDAKETVHLRVDDI